MKYRLQISIAVCSLFAAVTLPAALDRSAIAQTLNSPAIAQLEEAPTEEAPTEETQTEETQTEKTPPTGSEPTVDSEKLAGQLELVATFEETMPAGVSVSAGNRIFVTFPRWGDEVPFTVGEVVDGVTVPYPNLEINTPGGPASERFVSVQSVVVAPDNRLWALDAASVEFGEPPAGGPKLVEIDLETDEVVRTIVLPPDVARPTSYLNDVRFDLTRGEAGMAFITDSSIVGDNGLIVVDLATGDSWRRLDRHVSTLPEENFMPIVEGRVLMNRPASGSPSPMTVGADGIALDPTGERLFYRVLSGRRLYSVSVDALVDESLDEAGVAETIVDYGDLGFASDGLEADTDGQIYLTNYEDNGILIWQANDADADDAEDETVSGTLETLVHNPAALWPDTLSLATDGYLYFISNQLHRQAGFHSGEDLRDRPYALYRIQTNASPVQLK